MVNTSLNFKYYKMKSLLFLLSVTTIGTVTTWAQRSDLNGDGVINSADVVYLYNDIATGIKDEQFTVKGVTFKMIAVEGGTFQMGATSEQGSDANKYEKPVHKVTLSSYHIGQTEVTQALWKAVMGYNYSKFKGDNLPVESVSWHECQIFIQKLNAITGKHFRLSTEAEWEYACRGGNKKRGLKYSGSSTLDGVAWYSGNSSRKTHPVATKQPNELGIYDMSGNVAEWCQDNWGDYRSEEQTNPTFSTSIQWGLMVIRGGNYYERASYCRSSCRLSAGPLAQNNVIGMRLALTM